MSINSLLDVPIASVIALTPERAVTILRAIIRAECGYAKLSPNVLTISGRFTVADGGIDAEISVPAELVVPTDFMFQSGLTGIQIKSGTAFKPWTPSAIRGELLDGKGSLCSEVERLVRRHGGYTLLCTGHDLTPEQRNDARQQIATVLAEAGFVGYEGLVEVLGASQIAEFAERYPGTASMLAIDPIQEAWVLEEWQRDAHMANAFEVSPEQSEVIARIRAGLQGDTKHIRVLGEPGLGKTRIVLEAVKNQDIAPYVIYIQHGSRFSQTRLFRQLLKSGYDKPLVLVIDELPEHELSDIWRHLKPRCGTLKIVSLDHGRDETYDGEIDRINAPRLPDETIRAILERSVGESLELDRWVAICEGSPRVAQAIAENLRANPGDVLKSPATVPIWARFLHGYGDRDAESARQIDCVTQHLALFSRFGYEAPVADEALYISQQVEGVDPTIGWARFQEIVQGLRARRVLQGSRTLFFVPKALHIYLWKRFWERYGRGFNFTKTFNAMPESLHVWFMNMFKFAGDSATAHVIDDVLRSDGIFADRKLLTSAKGSRFLSHLAEANPTAVLKLLESTIGTWADEELLDFEQDRQNLVWTLEKIAVWPAFTVRAIHVLTRLAVNENAKHSNNSTGTVVGLFRIGPDAAATESTPEARLPAMLKLLRASGHEERRLALKAMGAALDSHGLGWRTVGPEYQGLKERAKLWRPVTYGEWWNAKFIYFQALVNETRTWPAPLKDEVRQALLEAVKHQIRTPPCTELAFQVLVDLVDDRDMSAEHLNGFFSHWNRYEDNENGKHPEVTRRIRYIERRYTCRDLASMFQRYVINVDWMEWDEDFRERHNKPRNRAKILVKALACRIARNPDMFGQVGHLLAPTGNSPALWYFGEQLALNDLSRTLLPVISVLTLESKHHVCLHGYLSSVRAGNPNLYTQTIRDLLNVEATAWLGVTLALRSDYDDGLFALCLMALEKKQIDPMQFSVLRFGRSIESIPLDRATHLLRYLSEHDAIDALFLLLELLDAFSFDASAPFTSELVYVVAARAIPKEKSHDVMRGYHWKSVCLKLVKWDGSRTLPLLDKLLIAMGDDFSLSYHSDVSSVANEIVKANSVGAWKVVSEHFEAALPKMRHDILHWLKGTLTLFDESDSRGAIADMPLPEILEWIAKDPEPRAALMANAAPKSFNVDDGGQLTRELLYRYGHLDRVQSGISLTFHSGGWSGPASAHLRRNREKFRHWLAAGFEAEVVQWIESEIEYLDRRIEREEIDEERSRFN